jgi:hypothetical protein
MEQLSVLPKVTKKMAEKGLSTHILWETKKEQQKEPERKARQFLADLRSGEFYL